MSDSPLSSRYASPEIQSLFSSSFKQTTWRRLWVELAIAQKKLGLQITESQIQAMRASMNTIDFAKAALYEKQFRHDVMAHIHVFGEACPEAKAIIHLGATSCFVTDNADLVQMKEALLLIRNKLVVIIRNLASFCKKQARLPCLSYTHFQPAQPTTVGRRAALWLQDFVIDLEATQECLDTLHFLGAKGATGTQASFLTLFDGDHSKVKQLDKLIATAMGFSKIFPLSGQTYTRKQDAKVAFVLSSFAASAHKCATDLRLLAHLKECEEPFISTQVGSSAMPYKRNPILSERVCGLARFLMSLQENPLYTHATQWFERTLDDSSNRRLTFFNAFLTADALCNLLCHLTKDPIIYPKIIQKHLEEELPFLATETLLMEAVKNGKDRQTVHERLRKHTQEASRSLKEEDVSIDLLRSIAQDPAIGLSRETIDTLSDPRHFIGRAIEQTSEFLQETVEPLLHRYAEITAQLPPIEL